MLSLFDCVLFCEVKTLISVKVYAFRSLFCELFKLGIVLIIFHNAYEILTSLTNTSIVSK